jgi:hypothetical protein
VAGQAGRERPGGAADVVVAVVAAAVSVVEYEELARDGDQVVEEIQQRLAAHHEHYRSRASPNAGREVSRRTPPERLDRLDG